MDNKIETFTFFGGEPFTPEQNDLSIKRVFVRNADGNLELQFEGKSTPIDLLAICADQSKQEVFIQACLDMGAMFAAAKSKADKWDGLHSHIKKLTVTVGNESKIDLEKAGEAAAQAFGYL